MKKKKLALSKRDPSPVYLTPAEQRVLPMIAGGLSDNEIAALLGVGARAINKHRMNMMMKSGAANTVAMVVILISTGALHPEQVQYKHRYQ